MSRAEDQYVDRLAMAVKQAYMEERRMFYIRTRGEEGNSTPRESAVASWDGGHDCRGAVHKSKWKAIVQFALKHRVDPIELVRAVFEMCESNLPPLPNQVMSLRALEDLKRARELSLEDLKLRYAGYTCEAKQKFLFWREYRAGRPDIEVWKEVACSPELSLSPLFRFCLAQGLGLAQVAELWRKRALLMYIRAPDAYDKVLGEALPKDFQEESEQLRKLVCRDT